jgi:alkylation response protein AidB-like acyl-CoA dehydrogenase
MLDDNAQFFREPLPDAMTRWDRRVEPPAWGPLAPIRPWCETFRGSEGERIGPAPALTKRSRMMSSDLASQYGFDQHECSIRDWSADLAAGLPPSDDEWEETGTFPWSVLEQLAESSGALALTFPARHAGRDGSRMDAILLVEQLAMRSFVVAEAVHLALNGPAYFLAKFGASELASRWLPPVAAGTALISIAITEESAGTALGDICTRFDQHAGGIRVEGRKCFVTGGALAAAHLVVGRFGGEGSRGLGAVLVPAGTRGLSVERTYRKMGGNALPEAAIQFEDAWVPRDHVLIPGGPMSSAGLKEILRQYGAMRLGIAAMCIGTAQGAMDRVVDHLRTREQGGQRLADHQGVRWTWARLALDLEQARLLTYRAARAVDEDGLPSASHATMAKLAASEVAVAITQQAIQAFGWRGIARGREFPVERVARESRGWTIAGGTTESLLNSLAHDLLDD